MMCHNGFCLKRRTLFCQHVPSNFSKKVIAFQQYVTGLHEGHDYLLSQMGNADETPVSFDEPSNNVIEEIGTKSVIIKTLGNEKMCITVMLAVLADGIKLPPYVILKRKTMLKDQLPTGIIVRCQNQGWMWKDFAGSCLKDWLNEGLAEHRLEQETRCAGTQKENACPRCIQRVSNTSNEEYHWRKECSPCSCTSRSVTTAGA